MAEEVEFRLAVAEVAEEAVSLRLAVLAVVTIAPRWAVVEAKQPVQREPVELLVEVTVAH